MRRWVMTTLIIAMVALLIQGQDLYSFEVRDLETNKVLAERSADLLAVPASTWKIITCYLAYAELGPGFRFKTTLARDGKISEGDLIGDLIIIGGGDPSLGSKHFNGGEEDAFAWIQEALADSGISCIKGDIIVDASEWGTSTVPWTWPWYDLGNYYASGAWSLNFLDNANWLRFELGGPKDPPELMEYTGPSGLTYINELSTGKTGSGDGSYIFGAPFQSQRIIRGTLPPGPGDYVIKGSIPEPPAYFGERLQDYLEGKGIQSDQVLVRYQKASHTSVTLKTHDSPELSRMIELALRESDNLYCEAFFRAVTRAGNYKLATEMATSIAKEVCETDLTFYDGAGLSPFNRLSARSFNDILSVIHKRNPEFWVLLPDISMTSLYPYYKEKDFRVKSGYMENVRTYVGILDGRYAVSLLYNGSDHWSNNVKKTMASFLRDAVN